jgi:hypothetical protein
MAVISGFHVDDYCLPAFREAVSRVVEQLGGEKVYDFAAIKPGDFIARVPPKIVSDNATERFKEIPIYRVLTIGDDFDEEGKLVWKEPTEYLYFEMRACYQIDLNSAEPVCSPSNEFEVGTIGCFEAREIGAVKAKYEDIEDVLKGILFRIPSERVVGEEGLCQDDNPSS